MASQHQNSGETQMRGIGPHFSRDAITLLNIYTLWGITHTELRLNLERLGVELQEWPEEREVPTPPPLPPIPPQADLELYTDEDEEA